ncbi:hypothetical protein ACFX13_038428 [Malus domestica]|uniref:Uncharacterized protein n=1 Tax=Malus baccata TaxID=106549 RepID=A0A540NC21_MALBA|nr:uncharacterized protein LOC103420183 [Malus domestica]XP_028960347.1 uncharacterized protein LOC103420183 [Malus domestica]XP_028960348.1 uncharacterized protein LOC103420183 [Malus domestica]XP_028960349.1 uncharacterized protein LOC103420183 [Malus domestica]XP_028960350.1 uncharacterized protein LOC103420183 [Malus domestica]XP_050151298.1 uncharacterized protein LOC126626124 [Malus sylvestris]XP_050151299.1 uncharacterized protein LOC126626124 [Malus sylvestris]XP_050151300.1 uncharac
MNKLIEFGKKALFYARVLSGYEERRIRSFRLEVEKRLKEANARKLALRKIPEQTILSEVRRMVEEMQTLNRKLEETEAQIEEYFKPIDKEAEMIMKTQLEGEERTMKEMMKAMHQQALLEKTEAEKEAQKKLETDRKNQESRPKTQHLPPPP